jgi:hypothetical protein
MNRYHPEITNEVLAKEYLAGLSAVELSEKYKMTAQAIYLRLRKVGINIRDGGSAQRLAYKKGRATIKSGENHPCWKGGKSKDKRGYIQISHGKNSGRPEHRVVWEEKNGKIKKGYVIHHLNGIRTDNRIENLCPLPRKRHSPSTIIEPHQKRIRELEKLINKLLCKTK